jgi:cytochrome c oxidase cbb3-type subunit 3
MSTQTRMVVGAAALLTAALISSTALAQGANPGKPQVAPQQSLGGEPSTTGTINTITNANMALVPLVNNIPGSVELPTLENPVAQDPQAAQRGMVYFEKMNCVGCHAPNGAGGMGPSLSDESRFKYPSNPAALYLVISHGAPFGMPAWGSVLPHSVIWDIVSYIESINKDPTPAWGRTTSIAESEPGTEQVPAEFQQTTTPWNYMEKFSSGRKPTGHNPTSQQETDSSGSK